MIFTETREGRRFVGEVPPGQPLIASLRTLTENYRIASGWFDGTGYVRDPRLRRVLRDGTIGGVELHRGTWLLTSMRAAVSEHAGNTDLVVRVALAGEDGAIAGLLEEAMSGSVEIMAFSFDDITLRRFDDPRAGFARWLDVAVHVVSSNPNESVRSGRVAMEAMPSRLLEAQEMPQLKVGDALEHPRLGTCVITQVVDQDRVSIQMESGQIAQLHLGLLTLARSGSRQGRNVYSVQVRRRNA